MPDYARSDILVDGDWLHSKLNDPRIRIVDCDNRDAYRRAHIPGAAGVRDNYFKNPKDRRFILEPDQFAKEMSRLGIGDDTFVVAYDAFGTLYASRLWWCLNYYGHRDVRILNGGWNQWFLDGRPASIEEPHYGPATFTPRPDESFRASAEYVMESLNRPDVVILDVRSDEEWEARNDRGNKRAGHIPGAVHIEWLNNVTEDLVQSLKTADQLRSMFEAAGVSPDREIVTHCQAGVRAAQAAMTLSLLGYERVRNYDGSFLEWANRDDTPLVRDA
jgi:thiosulfate/3-mercaptopyruvate sulfurtransferase